MLPERAVLYWVFQAESNISLRLLVFELLRNGESLGLIDRTGVQKGHVFV